eukprot:1162144-Prorocentrum_minimum.AAC.1
MPAHAHTPPHLQPLAYKCAHTPAPSAPCLHMRTPPTFSPVPAHAHTSPHLQPRTCTCAHSPTPAAPCLHMRTHPRTCSP